MLLLLGATPAFALALTTTLTTARALSSHESEPHSFPSEEPERGLRASCVVRIFGVEVWCGVGCRTVIPRKIGRQLGVGQQKAHLEKVAERRRGGSDVGRLKKSGKSLRNFLNLLEGGCMFVNKLE